MLFNMLFNDLYEDLEYPEDVVDAGIEGVVYVNFLLDKNGEIGEIKVTEVIEGADRYVKQLRHEVKNAVRIHQDSGSLQQRIGNL